ncbi:ribonuclease HII [Candidatus Leptofilum sp.]|uniref:ribonuclease HII n=1 Tax=Candidatus Leptofilum sp. TaxID=3241576 RepID=UPI003B59D544
MANLGLETAVSQQHQFSYIAGIDEAGRGALAGPVVAAAVILPLDGQIETVLSGVNDSKQLSAKKREVLFGLICQHALAFGIGQQPASIIDEIGILPANRLAMATAVSQLTPAPQFLLIDGRIRLPQLNIPQKSIVRGDSKSLSIAAASILAKVTRDRIMVSLDAQFPLYGFAQHKGYGTEQHRDAITQHGPCTQHRHSFAPIRQTLI